MLVKKGLQLSCFKKTETTILRLIFEHPWKFLSLWLFPLHLEFLLMVRKKLREREFAGQGDEFSQSSESDNEHVRDLNKKPLLRWNEEGKFVKVSTALPSWSGRVTARTNAVTSAVYRKKNLKECHNVPSANLPNASAQAILRAATISHHLGQTLRATQKRVKHLEEELVVEKSKDPYNINNPAFRKVLLKYTKCCSDALLGVLKERGALNPEFKDIEFADLFPEFAKLIEESEAPQAEEVRDYGGSGGGAEN